MDISLPGCLPLSLRQVVFFHFDTRRALSLAPRATGFPTWLCPPFSPAVDFKPSLPSQAVLSSLTSPSFLFFFCSLLLHCGSYLAYTFSASPHILLIPCKPLPHSPGRADLLAQAYQSHRFSGCFY